MSETNIPNKKAIERTVKSVFRLLFPITHSDSDDGKKNFLLDSRTQMQWILTSLFEKSEKVSNQFFKNLKKIKDTLLKDTGFILESDPAAKQLIEIIAIYPGFFALFRYRVANSLTQLSVPLRPRMKLNMRTK